RVGQGLAPVQPVLHIVRKVATVAAVEEDPDRFEGLAGGVRDCGHRQGPRGAGLLVHRAPKAPGIVLGGGDLLVGGHLGLPSGLIVATSVVTRCSIEKPSAAWPLSRTIPLTRAEPRTGRNRHPRD